MPPDFLDDFASARLNAFFCDGVFVGFFGAGFAAFLGVTFFGALTAEGEIVAYCAEGSDPNGFGGKLTVLVGFDNKGAVQGYRVLESAETPGLGAKAGEWFQKGQKGDIIGMSPEKNNMTVSKDGGEVDAITASTITSRAFLRCVNAAYEALAAEDAQSGATRQAGDNTNEED